VCPGDAIARPQRLANGVAICPGSQGNDAPDHFMADDHGQLDLQGQRALPKMDIGAADRARLNPCQDRTGLEFLWDGHLFDAQRCPELPHDRGLAV
jgi:hypothetical protein